MPCHSKRERKGKGEIAYGLSFLDDFLTPSLSLSLFLMISLPLIFPFPYSLWLLYPFPFPFPILGDFFTPYLSLSLFLMISLPLLFSFSYSWMMSQGNLVFVVQCIVALESGMCDIIKSTKLTKLKFLDSLH